MFGCVGGGGGKVEGGMCAFRYLDLSKKCERYHDCFQQIFQFYSRKCMFSMLSHDIT